MTFSDRKDAGRQLAAKMKDYKGHRDLVVLALPRGGVPVGAEVARELEAPFDVFLVRKLGAPGQEELAMGAIASGGVRVLNPSVVRGMGISDEVIEETVEREKEELQRREFEYRGARPPLDLKGRVVVLVDDGLATGASMGAAVQAVREAKPRHIIVAVPTAAPDTANEISKEADKVISVMTPSPFMAVGAWYDDFRQTTDDEVRELLSELPPPEPREKPPEG